MKSLVVGTPEATMRDHDARVHNHLCHSELDLDEFGQYTEHRVEGMRRDGAKALA